MSQGQDVGRLRLELRYYAAIKVISTWFAVITGILLAAGLALYALGSFKHGVSIIVTAVAVVFALQARAYASTKVEEIEAMLVLE